MSDSPPCSASTTARENRRHGLIWAFLSAVGGALMVIPWKLANEIGDPSLSVLIMLGVAAIGNTGLIGDQQVRC